MGTVNTPLEREAASIFSDLGYTVSGDGQEIRAERKWRTVQVTPMPEPEDPPASGNLRCFVTYEDRLSQVEQTLTQTDPDYDWAIIGVGEGSDYVVSR
jgi:hypothetical protein